MIRRVKVLIIFYPESFLLLPSRLGKSPNTYFGIWTMFYPLDGDSAPSAMEKVLRKVFLRE